MVCTPANLTLEFVLLNIILHSLPAKHSALNDHMYYSVSKGDESTNSIQDTRSGMLMTMS